jgi:hypothetical protein
MEKLPSGQVRYPSHSWGVFAQDPLLDVGIAGEAWAEVVRSAWLESGGSEETFEATFPQLADYARKQPASSSKP